jgi:glutamate carboxypeptidase
VQHRSNRDLLLSLHQQRAAMTRTLEGLVNLESPSNAPDLLVTALDAVDDLMKQHLGSTGERVSTGDLQHLVWESADPQVLLLCHVDTVWPRGTVARWPFTVEGDRATGPGAVDMKGGIVQTLFALAALGVPGGVRMLVTTDEETGSATSRAFIEEAARGMRAALVMEAAYDGALKIARKGVSQYTVRIEGRAWHGSEPHRGVNASLEMARQMLDVAMLADDALGTTVTPTLAAGGSTVNTVPAHAEFAVDSRAASVAEQQRVEAAMHRLEPHDTEARLAVQGGINRAPMPLDASRALFERAQSIAASLQLTPLRGVEAPGGSDGQFCCAVGTPTLDGLGAVGGNAHAEGEWVDLASMAERTALLAALIDDVLADSAAP